MAKHVTTTTDAGHEHEHGGDHTWDVANADEPHVQPYDATDADEYGRYDGISTNVWHAAYGDANGLQYAASLSRSQHDDGNGPVNDGRSPTSNGHGETGLSNGRRATSYGRCRR